MQQNLWFHLLSFFGSVLEVPKYVYYLLESGDEKKDDGDHDNDDAYSINIYPFHLLSLLCIYISFCIIINLWGSAIVFEAKDGNKAKLLRVVLALLCAVDFMLMAGTMLKGLTVGTMDSLLESHVYSGLGE